MAVGAVPSWQRGAAVAETLEAAKGPQRLAWPLACLLIGGISAVLWSLIWSAAVAIFG